MFAWRPARTWRCGLKLADALISSPSEIFRLLDTRLEEANCVTGRKVFLRLVFCFRSTLEMRTHLFETNRRSYSRASISQRL